MSPGNDTNFELLHLDYTASAVRRHANSNSQGNDSSESGVEWVSFDDSSTEVTKLEDIVSDVNEQRNAYMLLYTLN